MPYCMLFAGVYNLAWGAFVVLMPDALFRLLNVPPDQWPNATGLAIWQCLGMVIGVFGVGYLAAATSPLKHWPIVLVGFLGKIFGPIGFVHAALINKTFPVEFGWTIITNDLIWWLPFGLILYAALRARRDRIITG
ncbi:MAG: alkyl hydroperoxide reductase [Phycisphaerales bacterium]|nr:alkyl hydroperoxide reductase [Phycisphaerales bacterium]